jgi:hypothetical protein
MSNSTSTLITVTCDRCRGHKRFKHLKHIDGGVCYKCDGTGVMDGYPDDDAVISPVVSELFFTHTIEDGSDEHIFQRTASGQCLYWVNGIEDGVRTSTQHLTLTLNELRNHYRDVRASVNTAA